MEVDVETKSFRPIILKDIIKERYPKLSGKIPGFVYRWGSKLLHVDGLNEIMQLYGHLTCGEFVSGGIKYFNIKHEVYGVENLPKTGKFMFAGNHPLGGLDGMIMLKTINENFGNVRTLTNDFLLEIGLLKDWFVPVNKIGSQSRAYAEMIEDLYQTNNQVLVFPAGLCSRKIKGKIVDLTWQKHFIQKAVQYKIDIIPFYLEGKNSNFFYNLANIRKFLRIKFNIEMAFLVDELFKQRGKTFRIYFGTPIPYATFNQTKKPIEWAEEVKKIAYSLAGK